MAVTGVDLTSRIQEKLVAGIMNRELIISIVIHQEDEAPIRKYTAIDLAELASCIAREMDE